MKKMSRRCWKVGMAALLIMAMVLQMFGGIPSSTKAAETGYTELQFADWSTDEGSLYGFNIRSLPSDVGITSLDKVAVSGKVNFGGDTAKYFRIGGSKGSSDLRHAGFSIKTDAGRLAIIPQGIGGSSGVILPAEEWSQLIDKEFLLRLAFDKDATSGEWTVTIGINGETKATINCKAANPGLYLANSGVEFGPAYTEMEFTDWSTDEGSLYGFNIRSLPESAGITSLDGVAVSGKVNFGGDSSKYFRIGGSKGSSDLRHAGFSIKTDAGRLAIIPQGIGGSSGVILPAEEWSQLIDKEFILRLAFDMDATTSEWIVTIGINGETKATINCKAATPGVYLANMGVTFGEPEVPYTEMSFEDWSVSEGNRWGYDVYSLPTTENLTSLDRVAVSGKVNFGGDASKAFRIGGYMADGSDARHAGFTVMTQADSGRLILWPQGIGNDTAHVILSADEWAQYIDKTFVLSMTFDKDKTSNTWTLAISIDGNLVGTFTCVDVTPGLYLANMGVTFGEPEVPYTEMSFEDWSVSEGNRWGYDVYSLPTTETLTSLDRVIVSGKVNFGGDTAKAFRIGGYMADGSDARHAGFTVMTQADSGRLILWPQGIGNDTAHVILSADEWAQYIDKTFVLSMTFDKDKTSNTWTLTISIDGNLAGTFTCNDVTPGLYLANAGVTFGEPYTEMEFGDWGVSEGQLWGLDIYSLTNKQVVSSLDHVAVSGTVNFGGNPEAYFRIGGYKNESSDVRHTGFTLRTQSDTGRLILWPQGIGADTAHVVMAAAEWAELMNQDIALRMTFDKEDGTNTWILSISINGTLAGTFTCNDVTPGLYIANMGTEIDGLGEISFEDLNVPDIFNPPTEMSGETEVGNFITAVGTSGNTTVISAADEDNDYQSTADFSAYGLDYVMDFNVDRELRVLQLTDTQIIDSAQRRTEDRLVWEANIKEWAPDQMYNNLFRYIIKTVREAKPDLILITGDVIYGEFDDDGTSLLALINCMDSLQIPWAPIFGNHDNESEMGVSWQCEQFVNSPYCLFNRRNEIGGNGNYSIGLAKNGQLQRVIYMMDNNGCANTNAFNGNAVKTSFGFTDAQKEWYANTAKNVNAVAGSTIPSFLAYHAPTMEMQEAVVAAGYQEAGSEETYTLGVDITDVQAGDSGTKGGKTVYTYDEEGLLEIMKEVGTDGAFFGHEHLNSLSVAYEGIRWTYGVKTGTYDSTPEEVGGTLITLAADSNAFTVSQIKTATSDMDNLYPRYAYTLPEAPSYSSYIVMDMTNDQTGYLIEQENTTVDDVAVYEGNYYKTAGDHWLKYVKNGFEYIKRLVLFIKGDTNLDNTIGIKDFMRMKHQTKEADAFIPNMAGVRASDLNGDGEIDSVDTELLLEMLLAGENGAAE